MDKNNFNFKFENLKEIHVGDVPSAKKGIIDCLLNSEENKASIPDKQLNSYIKGHQIGTYIENALKCDQTNKINEKKI
ncbi:hypothetical protein [Clostridium grantii]|uniref:Uncharacterized protein n=1 Tax=Clostridium grantii DSM 8605 TaxID=1121316 RepID=A0A1M5RTS2_9CLOT|nr:hypothetical protein [Clostridium grantii]SHH29707.1 hypothetical protein SAMN02745207_00720 [Clostridium grantii DSM 8605]